MKIRRYYVRDMREGMEMMRKELGPEGMIITTRKVRQSGLKGLFRPRLLEITAGIQPAPEAPRQSLRHLEAELASLKGMMERHFVGGQEEKGRETRVVDKWYSYLAGQDVDSELLKRIFTEIKESLAQEVQLTDTITAMVLEKKLRPFFKVAPEKQKRYQVFLGPTGVGKTTTLAKLAARYAFYQNEKVGLLTIDHYRIGAIDQLRTYAEIADLPLEVVMSPKDFLAALGRLSHCDRVLIDTAGRGSQNSVQIAELGNYIRQLKDAEKFLVISATTKHRDVKIIAQNFKRLEFNRLLYSKLDETNSYGLLVNGTYYTGLPVVYTTTGQNVPDDLELADPEKFCAYLMGADTRD